MASVYKRADVKSNKWYFSYKNEHGKNRVRVGFTDKRATQRLANDLEKNAQRIREGLIDPAEERLKEHRARSISDHLEEFEQSRRTKKRTDKHIKSTINRIESAIDALGWERIGDIDAGQLELYLGEVRTERDWSAKSYNAHLTAIKSFSKWLWKMGRCAVDPLASLSRAPENDDPKRPRRELTADEIERLLAATEAGPKLVRVTGADRAMLYRVLLGTGLRFSEAMSLTPEFFELDHATGPRVRVLPSFSKNGKPVFQPMPTDLAGHLRPWLASKKLGKPLWRTPHNACRAWLQKDLEAADVEYQDVRGEYADFHAMRHTYITRLNRAGTPLATAMSLARHSDPKLTLKAYDHANDADRRAAIAATFGGTTACAIEPKLAATAQNGHGSAPQTEPESPARKQIRKCPVRPGTHSVAQPRTTTDAEAMTPDERLNIAKWLNGNRFRIDSHEDAPPCTGQTESTPRRTRTFNPLIKSQLLYRLS